MNVGEFGLVFAFNTNFNLTAQTSLTLTFTKPDGTDLAKTSPSVTVGSVDRTNDDGTTFLSGQYANYTFALGDVDQEGEWQARLTYSDGAGQHLISDPGTFTVNP